MYLAYFRKGGVLISAGSGKEWVSQAPRKEGGSEGWIEGLDFHRAEDAAEWEIPAYWESQPCAVCSAVQRSVGKENIPRETKHQRLRLVCEQRGSSGGSRWVSGVFTGARRAHLGESTIRRDIRLRIAPLRLSERAHAGPGVTRSNDSGHAGRGGEGMGHHRRG